jgi:purine-nucleoside phosphorylase
MRQGDPVIISTSMLDQFPQNTPAQWLKANYPKCTPQVAIVLGSGLGEFVNSIQNPTTIPFHQIPSFPKPGVAGHSGNLVFGQIGNTQVAALQGRCHLYEGWSLEQSLIPLNTLIDLGVELIVLSNASGGINPRFQSGQVVAIDSHIDWLFQNPNTPNLNSRCASFLGRSYRTYDPVWIAKAQETASELGFSLTTGTYLATLGPNYETRAEYRAFARMGADMVGMSTVPESLLAMRRGIPVLAFSVVTNVANPDAPNTTEHAEVLEWSQQAKTKLQPIIASMISKYF